MARFIGKAENGEFVADYPKQRAAWLRSKEGKLLQESFNPPEKDKTAEQRGYYFGVMCQQGGDALGYFKLELDAALREKHLPWVEGKKHRYQKTMDRLTREEFSQYIDDCIITLAENGFAVPPPDRNWNTTGWYLKKQAGTL